MKIFLAGTSFERGYGGPAFSVSGLALALAQANVQVGVWSADGSATTSSLLTPHPALQPLGGTAAEGLAQFESRFGTPDIIHDNGMWLPHNHQIAKLAQQHHIPRIVSIRGMLEPWAINHKKWKKKLAWHLYQKRDLQLAQCLHVTSPAESGHIQDYKLGVPIRYSPNGIDLPFDPKLPARPYEEDSIKTEAASPRIALFVGRLYPVKGLPMLIEAWARLRPEGWVLQIAGPDEAGHKQELEALIQTRGLSDVVHFLGTLDEDNKRLAYLTADFFVLPTYTENFGMVVAESLAHGLPVLTTKGAPWPMLAEHNCGWWVDISTDAITDGLKLAISKDNKTLKRMGAAGHKLVKEEFGWERVTQNFIEIYKEIRTK